MNAPQVQQQLLRLTVPHWRSLCHELDLQVGGRKDEVTARVLAYLRSEEGRKRVHSSESSALLRFVGQVLGLPRPQGAKDPMQENGREVQCVCGGAVRKGPTLQCTRCTMWQHRACVGVAASMPVYECPACQLLLMEPLSPILDTVLEPSTAISPGVSAPREFPFIPKAKDRVNLDRPVQIRCIKLTASGYYQRWPREGTLLINNKIIEEFTSPPNMVESLIARKRWDRPYVVTNLVQGAQNQVAVMWEKLPLSPWWRPGARSLF